MRIPTLPHILRTIYALSNYTLPAAQRARALQPFARGTILKSMPTIPFLGSLFSSSSSSSKNMSYPVQKSDDEWRAVLSKGTIPPTHPCTKSHSLPHIRSNTTPHPHRTIPHPPRQRHRSALHRPLRQAHPERGDVRLRGVRGAALQGLAQVQVRVRVAGVFRQHPGGGDAACGSRDGHGADGDRVFELRGAFGACF